MLRNISSPIPAYAKTVGIVTAPTGAAVRDIINIAGRRNPYVQLILISGTGTGRGGGAQYCQRGIRLLERMAGGCDDCRTGRRFHGRSVGF